MGLNSEEATSAFSALSKILREENLDWVITQVEEKLALGKIQTRKLAAREYIELDEDIIFTAPKVVTRKAQEFAVSEEYDAHEALDILLDAITIAVCRTNDIAVQTFSNLEDFGIAGTLIFEPEAQVTERFELRHSDLISRRDSTTMLVQLIDELRGGELRAHSPESSR